MVIKTLTKARIPYHGEIIEKVVGVDVALLTTRCEDVMRVPKGKHQGHNDAL